MRVPVDIKVIRNTSRCNDCGIVGGFHEPTCLVYVRELEGYRDRLERQYLDAVEFRDRVRRLLVLAGGL